MREIVGPDGLVDARRRLLYEEIAAKMGALIEGGTYRPGDRMPSIRELSRQMRVSVGTVVQAYSRLEDSRVIEARPQSGYYVCGHPKGARSLPEAAPRPGMPVAKRVTLGDGPLHVMRTLADPSLIPLGIGAPNPEHLPGAKLGRMLTAQARRFPDESLSYASTTGVRRLRTQIARRSLDAGCTLTPEDVVITSGCVEAVTLALQVTCRSGNTVAIAAPACDTFLHFAQWMGLKVLEIPSDTVEGMNLDVLAYAIRQNPIHACIIISSFNNPLGSLMPEEKKRGMVCLLAKHGIPLIEDDVYGELGFGRTRPPAAKAYDEEGLVLLCSSFSKTLAPGYRVGWIAPGRFQAEVERLKRLINIATASPTQLAVAEFLTSGGYDRHLRAIRQVYARQMDEMRAAVMRHFPPETSVTCPRGGFLLWVEMPEAVDTLRLYSEALREGIGIAPGTLFSTSDRFKNCLRLNASFWSGRIERAVQTLGRIARGVARGARAGVGGQDR